MIIYCPTKMFEVLLYYVGKYVFSSFFLFINLRISVILQKTSIISFGPFELFCLMIFYFSFLNNRLGKDLTLLVSYSLFTLYICRLHK